MPVDFAGICAVEGESAGRVPCDVNDLQLDSRNFNGVAFVEVAAESGGDVVSGKAEHLRLFILQA